MKTMILTLFAMAVGSACLAAGVSEQKPASLASKLNSIVIPEVAFREATLSDVVEFLVATARQGDPEGIGVNILLMDRENNSKITMSLKKVTLRKVLEVVAELAWVSLDIDDQVVFLRKARDKK